MGDMMKNPKQILNENQKTLFYKKDLQMIKNAWLINIKNYTWQSCTDLYYLNMAKIAVCLFNHVNKDLYLNHCCHKGLQFEVEIADNRARDLAELFRYDLVTFQDLISYLESYSSNERYYFLVRLVYPSFLFDKRDYDVRMYRDKIKQVIDYLHNQIYIPSFVW